MNTKLLYIALAVLALALGAASPGFTRQSGDGDILQKAINKPSANWQMIGEAKKVSAVKDKALPGGGAMKVEVLAGSAQPWSVAAQQPIQGKVTKGDVILVAFWAKAEGVDGGPASANIANVRVQEAGAPYGAAVQGPAKVGAEWAMVTVPGRATMDIPAGGANVSLHLGSAKQTVLLGPVFVLDFGPDYDLSKLAK